MDGPNYDDSLEVHLSPPKPPGSAWLGKVLKDTYRIDELIGEGGAGLVFRGHHQRLKVPIAIKILKQSAGEIAYARFRKEAEITARLRHGNIVQALDYDASPDGHAFLVTEWLEGETLSSYMKRNGAVSAEVALPILRGVAEAIGAAHAAQVVHRDLKPANIFLCRTSTEPPVLLVKVLDFGIAKLTELDPIRTEQGQTVGTPRYMSPEQIRIDAGEDVGPASDQFSLAAIAYEMVSGKPAFPGSAHAAMLAVLEGRPAPLPPSVPRAFQAVIAKALSQKTQDRYPSVVAFLDALEESLTQPDAEPVISWPGSAWLGAAAVFGAISALLILLGGLGGLGGKPSGKETLKGVPDLRVIQPIVTSPLPAEPPDLGGLGSQGGPTHQDKEALLRIEVRPTGVPRDSQFYVNGRPVAASSGRLSLPDGQKVRLRVVPPKRSCCEPQEINYTAGTGKPPPAFSVRCERDCLW